MKLVYGFGTKGVAGSGKSTSRISASGKATSGLFDGDLFKGFFRAGRSFLDAFAASSGIPLAQLRQGYKNGGVDPDQMNEIVTASFEEDLDAFDGYNNDQLNHELYQAQLLAKRTPALTLIVGALAAIFLLGMIRR